MNDIRKLTIFIISLLAVLSCAGSSSDMEMDRFIDELMEKMTLQEKLGQMSLPTGGDVVSGTVKSGLMSDLIRNEQLGGFLNVKGVDKIYEFQRMAVEETRLGIPLLVGADVIHGYETIFPIPLALSCSWNMESIERMARISAIEASADGVSWTFSPMVDICRDARWSRIAEGGGEDPYLGSLIGQAYVRGYQGDLKDNDEILACVKHFALYGASESGRDYNTVDMSEYRMFNGYFPPYKACVEAGAATAMSSFNLINGTPATADKWLLTDVLRDQWGFDGFLVTDYNSIKEMTAHGVAELKDASVRALKAGTDMDMVANGFLNTLEESLEEGLVSQKDIDLACRRILEAKYKLGLFENPYKYCDTLRAKTQLFTPEHRAEARRIAAETFVLMKNSDNILPLQAKGRIALIGPLADAQNQMCGNWSMGCKTDGHITLLDGLKRAVADRAEVLYAKGSNIYYDADLEKYASGIRRTVRGDDDSLLKEALDVAHRSDVIVAALGECSEMSGESPSRVDITIPDAQKDLLKALVNTGKPVILVLFTGRPLVLKWEDENVDAILNVWFAGSEAGDAIADVLLGKVNPSGKLTTTFPRSVGQLPMAYNVMNTGRPDSNDERFNRYASNYLDERNTPLYPFGYGLSYTQFSYGEMSLSSDVMAVGGEIEARITVTNTGDYDGCEIVQLYIRDVVASSARPVKELKGFKRIFLKKGESEEVCFRLTAEDLKFYDAELEHVCEPGDFSVMIGPNSRDIQHMTFTAL